MHETRKRTRKDSDSDATEHHDGTAQATLDGKWQARLSTFDGDQ